MNNRPSPNKTRQIGFLVLILVLLVRPTGLFGGREFAFLKLKTGGIRVFTVKTFTNWVKGLFTRKEKKVKEEAAK